MTRLLLTSNLITAMLLGVYCVQAHTWKKLARLWQKTANEAMQSLRKHTTQNDNPQRKEEPKLTGP